MTDLDPKTARRSASGLTVCDIPKRLQKACKITHHEKH